MKLGRWSTTAANNNSTPPDGWPEGQAPSTVNDCAREMMAQLRTVFNDAQYFDQDFSPTYVSATSFTVPGNQTSAIHAGRRLKLYDATAGAATVIYATVVTASYTAVTTIQVANDAGQLTSSLSSFAIAILSANNNSLPRQNAYFDRLSASAIEVTTLTASGAVVMLSTLSVSGAAVFAGTLSVSGAAVLSGALNVSGAVACLSTLNVSGATVILGALSVSGAASFGTTFSVSGSAAINGALTVGGAVTFGTTLSVSGSAAINGALSVGGAATFGSTISGSAAIVALTFIKSGACTVASLPAAATAGQGARYMVTDANASAYAAAVAGGGANIVPVWSDGTNWKIG